MQLRWSPPFVWCLTWKWCGLLNDQLIGWSILIWKTLELFSSHFELVDLSFVPWILNYLVQRSASLISNQPLTEANLKITLSWSGLTCQAWFKLNWKAQASCRNFELELELEQNWLVNTPTFRPISKTKAWFVISCYSSWALKIRAHGT